MSLGQQVTAPRWSYANGACSIAPAASLTPAYHASLILTFDGLLARELVMWSEGSPQVPMLLMQAKESPDARCWRGSTSLSEAVVDATLMTSIHLLRWIT